MPLTNIKTNILKTQTASNAPRFIIRTMKSDLSGIKISGKTLYQSKSAKSQAFIQNIRQAKPAPKMKQSVIQPKIKNNIQQAIDKPKTQTIPAIKLEQAAEIKKDNPDQQKTEPLARPAQIFIAKKQLEQKPAQEKKYQNQIAQLKQNIDISTKQRSQDQNTINQLQATISSLKQSIAEQKQLRPKPIIQPQANAVLEPRQPIAKPSLQITPQKKTIKKTKQGLVMSILIIILLITLGVLVYFIFFNKPESKQIIKQEPEIIIEPEPDAETQPITSEPIITVPKSLIPVEKDLILNINAEKEVLSQIKSFLDQTLDSARISQLVLAEDNQPVNLNTLLSKLKIFLPERIKNNLAQDYTLLSFAPNNHFELGLILKINNTLPVLSELSFWQKNISYDLKSLFIDQQIPETTEFRINNQEYPNIVIHFQNTSDLENSLHYTISQNNLIITPSSSAIHLILNSMLN